MPGDASRENGKKGGRPEGSKSRSTLEKEAMRELLRTRVARRFQALIDAQITNAEGLKYLVVRDTKTGKFLRVTEALAKAKQDLPPGEERIEVWEKDPCVQAFTDLMNRALDKPKEQEQEIKVTGALELVTRRLLAARKRLAERG